MYFRSEIQTPLGELTVVADNEAIVLLQFSDYVGLAKQLAKLDKSSPVIRQQTSVMSQLARELDAYFSGQAKAFTTPIRFIGTPFQVSVWQALQTIAYGATCYYRDVATVVQKPKAYRAIGQAIKVNPITIVVPCHRVVASDGSIGGYNSGQNRKRHLLTLEKKG